jgi:hypothetical protein
VAGLAEDVLAASRGLTVLATSRERLAAGGEQVLVVPPLEVPAAGAEAVGGPAVRLFLDRAGAADPGVAAGGRLLVRVGDICRALDGLPLAIELAAARIGTLTVDDLADRLDARFDLLRSGRRGGDTRHQTLRAVVDWSFELLGADEQRLFLRLSVFAAGFDIAAAEMVAAGEDLPTGRVADLVARLAERSMLTRPGASGVGRYGCWRPCAPTPPPGSPPGRPTASGAGTPASWSTWPNGPRPGCTAPTSRPGRAGSSGGWTTCGPRGAGPRTPASSTSRRGSPRP